MNLLDAEWIPVRHAAGGQRRIAPHQITEALGTDPIVALAAPRADLNGALMQFLIGLVQTARALTGETWDREVMLWQPPAPDELRAWLAPLREAFEFDGEGPRFMQDFTLNSADNPKEKAVATLLIESPGEESVRENTDHFVKRDTVQGLCRDCAAAALYTLMTNAPLGGQGHRTSVRGGGPLTTLIVYDPEGGHEDPPPALWRDVASNVIDPALLPTPHGLDGTELHRIFPWLAAQETLQAPGASAQVQPLDVLPAHVFWAMPRRIRLDFNTLAPGACDLCGRSDQRLLRRYATRNYGLNYKGPWKHPLSPYDRNKPDEPARPMHPHGDGLGYRHWLGWVLGTAGAAPQVEPALAVRSFLESGGSPAFRLWAFGFGMAKMKARSWEEATFPLFTLPGATPEATQTLRGVVDALLAGADHVAKNLRVSVCKAWFGEGKAPGDLGYIEAGFWHGTEAAFFDAVRASVALVRQHGRGARDASTPLREQWIARLRCEALGQFDRHAASGEVEACHPERLAAAHRFLRNQLFGDALSRALGLASPERQATHRARRGAATVRNS